MRMHEEGRTPESPRATVWPGLALALLAGLALGMVRLAAGPQPSAARGVFADPAAIAAARPGPESFLAGRIGGPFDLVDQNGRRRRLVDFAGRHVLLFFGYANCEAICSTAIPQMAAALDALGPAHPPVDLVMITIDPARDTVAGLGSGLAKYDPRLIGLTGSRSRLQAAWKAFSVQISEVARDWNDAPIYAHGSFVYLLGPDGAVQSLIPPVLPPDEMARIIRRYL